MSRSSSDAAALQALQEEEVPPPVPETNRPIRNASRAVRTLLQELCLGEGEDDASEERGLTTAVEESQAEAGFADDDGDDDEDLYKEVEAVEEHTSEVELSIDQFALEQQKKLSRVVLALKKAKSRSQAAKDLSSDESSDEQGTYSLFPFGDIV